MHFVKRANLKEQYRNYLISINGYLRLTDREIDIMSLVLFYNTGDESVLNEKNRIVIREELGLIDVTFNNHIANLKRKNVIIRTKDGIKVNETIAPTIDDGEINVSFKFIING